MFGDLIISDGFGRKVFAKTGLFEATMGRF
jgi:hypothetical protein